MLIHSGEIPVCIYVCIFTHVVTTDDLEYAAELLNHSQMNTVERDLVDADVHNIIIELLDTHTGNPFIQEYGLATLEHLGDLSIIQYSMCYHHCPVAVLSGVVDIEVDSKLKYWLKIILGALKTHINEPAVQVTTYYSPSHCTVSHTHLGCSLSLLNTDISVKTRFCEVDRQ